MDLSELRAEVEWERASAERAMKKDQSDMTAQVAVFCFQLVLDLIDKQQEAGQ